MAKTRTAAALLLSAAMLCAGGVPCRAVRDGSREAVRREEREARAEEEAREILGSGTPLTVVEREGVWLFTCRNGYALVDPADGTVTEYALSFPGKAPVFFRVSPAEGRNADKMKNIQEK